MTYKKPVHDYRTKDSLKSGNPDKKVMGYELMEDFEAIAREIDKLEGGLAGEFVEKTGDVMTGPLTTPKLTATEIVAGKVSASTFHGDGEEITGIITDQLADVNSEDAERDDLLIFNGSVWEAGSLPFVETSLTFKGGLDLTDSSLYPTEISDGDLYVASEDGVVASEWTGIAGASVYTGNFVGWADSKMRWFLLGDLSSSAVTKVGAGEGIDVDDSVPAEPVVSIDRDEVDTWYADLGDFNDLTVEVDSITNIGPLVEEAPEDGLIYGRSDASWVEVTSGGGGGSSLWEQNGDDIYYNDGNVGIGTDAPNISGGGAASTSLTVSASASNGNGILELQGTRAAGSVVSYVRSFNDNGATPITDIVSYSGLTSPDTTGELAFHTSNLERMRIDASGNVGIGTDNPSSSLTISTGGSSRIQTTNGSQTLYSGTWAGLNRVESSGSQLNIGTGDANNLVLRTNNTDRVTIDASGTTTVTGGLNASSVRANGPSNTGAPTTSISPAILVNGGAVGPGEGGELRFTGFNNTYGFAAIKGAIIDASVNATGWLDFYTRSSTSDTDMTLGMRLDQLQNLSVTGNVHSAGTRIEVDPASLTSAMASDTDSLYVDSDGTSYADLKLLLKNVLNRLATLES